MSTQMLHLDITKISSQLLLLREQVREGNGWLVDVDLTDGIYFSLYRAVSQREGERG